MIHPVIGITMDYETIQSYSKFPWYALRENYAGSITQCGGIPLPLPHDAELVDAYMERMDGLIITGGDFDVSPELYGQTVRSDTVSIKHRRTAFEYAITTQAIARDMPVLGICGGQQLLNVILGGTLIQHIPDVIDSDIAHEQPNPRDETSHSVTITSSTQLHHIIGNDTIIVNSAHHQAVDEVGDDVIINATAPDGVVEGIEHTTHPFCIGVQWHPEFLITEADKKLYHAFINACRDYNNKATS